MKIQFMGTVFREASRGTDAYVHSPQAATECRTYFHSIMKNIYGRPTADSAQELVDNALCFDRIEKEGVPAGYDLVLTAGGPSCYIRFLLDSLDAVYKVEFRFA